MSWHQIEGCREDYFSFWVIFLISATMAGERRTGHKKSSSTEALLEQALPCSGDGTPLNVLHQMMDHLKRLAQNEVTCRSFKRSSCKLFIGVGEKCIILHAHFVIIRPYRKKGTNKIQTGMHVCMLRYHCKCSYSLVYPIDLRKVCFLNSDAQSYFGLQY